MVHGCTVHYVSPVVDGGAVIAQATVKVWPSDTEESLGARVLEYEHKVFPRVIRAICEREITYDLIRDLTLYNGNPIEDPQYIFGELLNA